MGRGQDGRGPWGGRRQDADGRVSTREALKEQGPRGGRGAAGAPPQALATHPHPVLTPTCAIPDSSLSPPGATAAWTFRESREGRGLVRRQWLSTCQSGCWGPGEEIRNQ